MSEINFIVDSSGTGNGNTHSRDRGNPIVPLGLWDRKDSGTLVALVGHGSPEDFPWFPWEFGMDRGSNSCLCLHVCRTHQDVIGLLWTKGEIKVTWRCRYWYWTTYN